MPQYLCSYAHDIACFADFVVEAKNERAALRQIRRALREGKFENVEADPRWENGPSHERVFVQGPAIELSTEITLEQLIGREHLFSVHTNRCIRCGRHAADDAVAGGPCPSSTIERKP